MKRSRLSIGSLSGNGNFGARLARPRLASNHGAFIIACVAMKIIIRSGNTCGLILFGRASLRTLKNGSIRVCQTTCLGTARHIQPVRRLDRVSPHQHRRTSRRSRITDQLNLAPFACRAILSRRSLVRRRKPRAKGGSKIEPPPATGAGQGELSIAFSFFSGTLLRHSRRKM